MRRESLFRVSKKSPQESRHISLLVLPKSVAWRLGVGPLDFVYVDYSEWLLGFLSASFCLGHFSWLSSDPQNTFQAVRGEVAAAGLSVVWPISWRWRQWNYLVSCMIWSGLYFPLVKQGCLLWFYNECLICLVGI